MSFLSPDRTLDVALRGAVSPVWAGKYVDDKMFESASPGFVRGVGTAGSVLGGSIGFREGAKLLPYGTALGERLLGTRMGERWIGHIIGALLGSAIGGGLASAAAYRKSRE